MLLPAKMVGMRLYVTIQGETLERLERRRRRENEFPRVLVERLLAEKLEEDEQREQAEPVPA